MLIGYCDRLSARGGERVTVHVSTDADRFDAELVRLTALADGPDTARELPCERIAGTRLSGAGCVQQTHPGSFGWAQAPALGPRATLVVWIWLMAPSSGRVQGVLAQRDAASGAGAALALDEAGRPCVLLGPGDRVTAVRPLRTRTWYLLAAGLDRSAGEVRLAVVPTQAPPGLAEQMRAPLPPAAVPADPDLPPPLLLGASASRAVPGVAVPRVEGLLDGKLAAPLVLDGLLDDAALARLAAGSNEDAGLPIRHRWELGSDTDAEVVRDGGAGAAALRLVNAPTLAMTGHRFDGRRLDPARAPEAYGAAHFHSDDLDDARWEPSAALTLPDGLPSGLYAVRLETAEEADHIPLVVPHDRRGGARPRNEVAFLAATMTQLAYANARAATTEPRRWRALNRLLAEHPEWGPSTYDVHPDGSGVSLSSALRPIVGMRPDVWSSAREEPVHFAAELAVVDWLEHLGAGYDVLCDHDLHADGADALDGYRVLVTGPHPEYASAAMLDAIAAFQRGGGSVLYLGGNGFYWVTSVSPTRPHLVEVRRGHSGGRAWSGEPGEGHQATTGEPGGLWRERGHAPNRLVGVGFSAMGAADTWPGYRPLPAVADPRAAFLLAGVGEPAADGAILHGAAGIELDRLDVALGSPHHALRVATSEGLHDDGVVSGPEDVPMLVDGAGFGSSDPRVRADLVFYETGYGGAVVSVGSIAWASRLADDGYDNDVARVTTNALRRLLDPSRFPLPA
jgi:N,N-dimethylformamidase